MTDADPITSRTGQAVEVPASSRSRPRLGVAIEIDRRLRGTKAYMMPVAERCVLRTLAGHADESSRCHPSVPTLAGECGLNERTARRALHALIEKKWLYVSNDDRRKEDGSRTSSEYTLTPELGEWWSAEDRERMARTPPPPPPRKGATTRVAPGPVVAPHATTPVALGATRVVAPEPPTREHGAQQKAPMEAPTGAPMEAPTGEGAAASASPHAGSVEKAAKVEPAIEAFTAGSGLKARHTTAAAKEILTACGTHRVDGKHMIAGNDVLPFITRAAASWKRATQDKKVLTTHFFAEWVVGLHSRDVAALLADGVTAADKLVTHFAAKYQAAFSEPYIQSPRDHAAAAVIVAAARVAAQRDNRWTDGEWAAHWQAWHLQHTSDRKCLDRLKFDVENRQAEMKTPGTRPRVPPQQARQPPVRTRPMHQQGDPFAAARERDAQSPDVAAAELKQLEEMMKDLK